MPQVGDGVGFDGLRSTRVHVAGGADLQMQAALAHGLDHPAPGRVAQGIHQMHTVADARGAQLGGFQHPFGAVGFCRVQGDGQAGVAHPPQRTRVLARGVTELRAREIEAHHPGAFMRALVRTIGTAPALVLQRQADGALGLELGQVAHGADDQPAGQLAALQAGQQRFHHGLARHAVGFEEQRRDTKLGQHHAVGECIFCRLEGHLFHRLRAGHGGHGERKTLEVLAQAAGVRVGIEPGGQTGLVVGRHGHAALAQQRQQGGHAQTAVEMFVQQHLGQLARARQAWRGSRGRAFCHADMLRVGASLAILPGLTQETSRSCPFPSTALFFRPSPP